MHDVVVVGAGPAGWAAAAACAEAGLDTAVVDPELERPWTPTYGAFCHEVADTGVPAEAWRHRWPEVQVIGSRPHRLGWAYGVFDNVALQRWLWERAADAGASELPAAAMAVEHGERTSFVRVEGGALEARVVVDATGGAARLLEGRPQPRATQVAHGIVTPAAVPDDFGPCVLMDWRTPVETTGDAGGASFLYALDLGPEGWLLEETSLAATPAADAGRLADRLAGRLANLGVEVGEVRRTERVHIPMGGPAPRPQRVVATGAAAGLVHPATGYSVAASLRVAPRLARALADALARRATPASVAAAGWQAVWPDTRRRARALEDYGLEAILGLGQDEAQTFFDAFFSLGDDAWVRYLSGTASPGEIASVMRRLFASVPWSLRRRLASGRVRPLLGGLRP